MARAKRQCPRPVDVTFEHRRVWQAWQTDEWRTDFPPPAGFDGDEKGDWEDEGYSRSLTDDELSALIAAGMIEGEVGEEISIEDDTAARDEFFASLTTVTPAPEPESTSSSTTKKKA